jgi:hypothetical protein
MAIQEEWVLWLGMEMWCRQEVMMDIFCNMTLERLVLL